LKRGKKVLTAILPPYITDSAKMDKQLLMTLSFPASLSEVRRP
jgi:hypothetical protein